VSTTRCSWPSGNFARDAPQEGQELLGPVARVALGQDLPGGHLEDAGQRALKILMRGGRFAPGPGASSYLSKVLRTAVGGVRIENGLLDLSAAPRCAGDIIQAPTSLDEELIGDEPGLRLVNTVSDEVDDCALVEAEQVAAERISSVPPQVGEALSTIAFDELRIADAPSRVTVSRSALHRKLDALSRDPQARLAPCWALSRQRRGRAGGINPLGRRPSRRPGSASIPTSRPTSSAAERRCRGGRTPGAAMPEGARALQRRGGDPWEAVQRQGYPARVP
jgi:hypothetical protein